LARDNNQYVFVWDLKGTSTLFYDKFETLVTVENEDISEKVGAEMQEALLKAVGNGSTLAINIGKSVVDF